VWNNDINRRLEVTDPKRSKLLKRLEKDTQPLQEDNLRLMQAAINMLQDADKVTHLKAARALIRIGEQAIPALIKALDDDEKQVWCLASAVLVKIGDPAVKPLIEALNHESEQIRLLAAGTLRKIGKPVQGEPGWMQMWAEYRKLLRYQTDTGNLVLPDQDAQLS
jgi:HEAT repeat protein